MAYSVFLFEVNLSKRKIYSVLTCMSSLNFKYSDGAAFHSYFTNRVCADDIFKNPPQGISQIV